MPFRLSPSFVSRFSEAPAPMSALGLLTYKRTYARPTDTGALEDWWQTCQRVVEGCYEWQRVHCLGLRLPWDTHKAQRSAREMYARMYHMKWLPPGRGLWTMGTPILQRTGAAANNCAFRSTQNIRTSLSDPFCFLMDLSMLGVGVGFDTRGTGTLRIARPIRSDQPYMVEDSREGWVNAVRTLLDAYAGQSWGVLPSRWDTSRVRAKGARICTFGGVASGPEPLQRLLSNLERLLDGYVGRTLDSSGIVDIANHIGVCVVAGGVRRTAEIAFGDPEDTEFITLKRDSDALMSHRWASNNSVFAKVGMDYRSLVPHIVANGEPGLMWLDNARSYGRMEAAADWRDERAMGANPCGEQTLEDGEVCNLVETFPARHASASDYYRTLKFAYLYAKTVTLIPTHDPLINQVVGRNRRIGCSQSGIQQATVKFGRRKYLDMCRSGYGHIQSWDRIYSDWLCVPRSIKCTSVKPSGTVSLLAGATPGIHYAHSPYYIRRVRIADTSPLVVACEAAGYHVEPDKYAPNTIVVSIPVREQHVQQCKDDVSIWQQFANAADLQSVWSDNQVSCTVTFRPDEVDQIAPCLEHFETQLKAISLLPSNDHGYVQAPYEAITADVYEEMAAGVLPLQLTAAVHEAEDKFCDGEACTL